jgi:cytochrome c
MATIKRVSKLDAASWIVLGSAFAVPGQAADDPQADQALAVSHCSQCHTFNKGEAHGQGPNLFGLVGREAAAVPGYPFSPGYKQVMKGKVWDSALLDRWLADTTAVVPETQMIYFQDNPAKRAALIRYLESLR